MEVLNSRRLSFHRLGAQTITIISKVCVISHARPKLTISSNIGCLIRDAAPAGNSSPNDDNDNTPRQNESVPGAPTQEPAVERRGSHSRASSTNPSWQPLCQSREPSRYPSPPPFRLATKPGLARGPSARPSPPPFRLATGPGLAREPSTCPSPPPFRLANNPSHAPSIASMDKLDIEPASRSYPSLPPSPSFSGRAPSASLDKSGFEPTSHTANTVCTYACSFFLLVSLVLQQRQAMKTVPTTKIIPPTLAAPSHLFSPSPATSPGPSHPLTIPDSTRISNATVSDKTDQSFVNGRVPDSVLAVLTEGFDEVDISLSKLAARVNMPFHQVVDRYHRSHTHAPGGNVWNIYAKYFAENQKQELSRLPDDEKKVALSISSSPDALLRKRCYDLFKAEYKNDYPVILETWREAHELDSMVGGTVARRQRLFDKTTKNLDHTVSRYLFTF